MVLLNRVPGAASLSFLAPATDRLDSVTLVFELDQLVKQLSLKVEYLHTTPFARLTAPTWEDHIAVVDIGAGRAGDSIYGWEHSVWSLAISC
jgi:hypothetical protein